MKILLIGPGYLGFPLGKSLEALGHEVIATATNEEKHLLLSKEFSSSLLLGKEAIDPFESADLVLFTAGAKNLAHYKETYLGWAIKIKEALEKHPCIKQVIYTSSTSVFGECDSKEVDETCEPHPITEGGKILLEAESVLLPHSKTCIFRLGELIGEGREIENRLRKNKALIFPGDGTAPVNLSPLNDVIRAFHFAIRKPLFGLYHVVTPCHMTRKELYRAMAEKAGLPMPAFDDSIPSPHGGKKRVLSNKIKKEGFSFSEQILP